MHGQCLKGCELLETLTNGPLMVMADLMQPMGGFAWFGIRDESFGCCLYLY